jgi:hypothetical protein
MVVSVFSFRRRFVGAAGGWVSGAGGGAVGVLSGVLVGVVPGMPVGVLAGVAPGVPVGVAVGVAPGVPVGVAVGVALGSAVGVGVLVEPPLVAMIGKYTDAWALVVALESVGAGTALVSPAGWLAAIGGGKLPPTRL